MGRPLGSKNRTLREIEKDSKHAVEKARLKHENKELKKQLKDKK